MHGALKDIEKMFAGFQKPKLFGNKPTIGDSVGESIRKMEEMIKQKESK